MRFKKPKGIQLLKPFEKPVFFPANEVHHIDDVLFFGGLVVVYSQWIVFRMDPNLLSSLFYDLGKAFIFMFESIINNNINTVSAGIVSSAAIF